MLTNLQNEIYDDHKDRARCQ